MLFGMRPCARALLLFVGLLATVVCAVASGGQAGALLAASGVTGTGPAPLLPGTECPAFPADNVWNTPVSGLPVDSSRRPGSSHMAAGTTFLHPDYGPGGGASPYGIPWQITVRHPALVKVRFTLCR